MPVEDVFSISGRGTVATGRVERGVLKMSQEVEIIGLTDERKKTTVTGIEMFHKQMDACLLYTSSICFWMFLCDYDYRILTPFI